MSQEVRTGTKAFKAAGAIPRYARVKVSAAGTVDVAGLADRDIGTALEEAFAAGDVIPVLLATASGTVKMIAGEALSVGAVVYTEASGVVQDTAASTAYMVGIALTAATAANDIIEVVRLTCYTPVP